MIPLSDLDPDLGRYLAHSLWQGPVVLLAYLAARHWLRNAGPEVRCRVAGFTVILLALLPVLTVILVRAVRPVPTADLSPASATAGLIPVPESMLYLLQRHLTFRLAQVMVIVWGIGVILSLLRVLVGVWRLNRVVARAGKSLSAISLDALARRAGLAHAPSLREWSGASAPFVAGWLRPVIVLPMGLTRLLAPSELEAVLLHELAHVKRNDVRKNLWLRILSTLAWHQLPLWKLLGDLARERELCCDELAVRLMGKGLPLASALITLEERRAAQPRFAMAGTGGDFTTRVRRIISGENGRRVLPRAAALIVTGLLAVTGSTLLLAASTEGKLAAWSENLHANIKASDPRGPFTVEMIGRRLISATIDGEVIPAERIVQRGETVQMLDHDGHPELTLEVQAPGRILWHPRLPRSP